MSTALTPATYAASLTAAHFAADPYLLEDEDGKPRGVTYAWPAPANSTRVITTTGHLVETAQFKTPRRVRANGTETAGVIPVARIRGRLRPTRELDPSPALLADLATDLGDRDIPVVNDARAPRNDGLAVRPALRHPLVLRIARVVRLAAIVPALATATAALHTVNLATALTASAPLHIVGLVIFAAGTLALGALTVVMWRAPSTLPRRAPGFDVLFVPTHVLCGSCGRQNWLFGPNLCTDCRRVIDREAALACIVMGRRVLF